MDRLLPTLRGQGFSCCHLALSKSFPEAACTPGALTPGYAGYLKRGFDKGGIDIAILGNYLNLLHPDEDYIDHAVKMYCAHLRFAALLGCTMVGTETGAPNREYQAYAEVKRDGS